MATNRRILHWVFKIGNRQKSIDFYKNILGKDTDQVSLFFIIWFVPVGISLNCCMCGCENRYRIFIVLLQEFYLSGIRRLIYLNSYLRALPSTMSESIFINGLFATNLSYFLQFYRKPESHFLCIICKY
jgi:hypothetical protein